MSLPHFDFPNSPEIAGDKRDDDADILDNLVESEARPPTPEQEPKVSIKPLDKPKPITRLMTSWINVDKAWPSPTLLAPADPKRKSLHITVTSTTATDVVAISDEMNKANGSGVSCLVPVFGGGIDLAGHTGPVYVSAMPNNVSLCMVSYVAVTE